MDAFPALSLPNRAIGCSVSQDGRQGIRRRLLSVTCKLAYLAAYVTCQPVQLV